MSALPPTHFVLPTHWPDTPIPLSEWQRLRLVPLAQHGTTLEVACAPTSTMAALDRLSFRLKCTITPVAVSESQLDNAFQAFSGHTRMTAEIARPENAAPASRDDTVEQLHTLVNMALRARSSDIHLEPYEQGYRQRCRIDGELQSMHTWTRDQGQRLIGRLKLLAGLDIAQSRLPQDGALQIPLADSITSDIRLSTLPTLEGEKAVLRFVTATHALRRCDQLGLQPFQSEALQQALMQRSGLILVTGPTGSGKSASLYSMLIQLAEQIRANITSVEDPVEASVSGVSQVQIDRTAGLDFACALRAFLRQDPDVMMIGEMRDAETAHIAIQAAQTGHLVLSSLHTGSAAATLVRLRDLGLAPYHLAAGIRLIVAQRLIRCLCPFCRIIDEHVPPEVPTGRYYRSGHGCDACHEGYQGRRGVFEVVSMTPSLRAALVTHQHHDEWVQCIRDSGTPSLFEAGLTLAAEGHTSLEEVYRVAL